MKKLAFALLAVLGAFALRAEDSYLYWMIGSNAATEMGVQSLENYTAKIWSVQDNNYLNLYAGPDSSESVKVVSATAAQQMGVAASLGSSTSGSFFVELWNDGALQGRSDTYNYDTVSTFIDTIKFTSNWPKNAFAFGGFHPVPEPNSALMLLMGLSALALRRRKRA